MKSNPKFDRFRRSVMKRFAMLLAAAALSRSANDLAALRDSLLGQGQQNAR